MRFLIVEIVALFVSILIIITIFVLAVNFAVSALGTSTSNEGDLGEGIIVMGVATGSLFFSVPLAVLVHIDILIRFLVRPAIKSQV
jgi:hypothetical protein